MNKFNPIFGHPSYGVTTPSRRGGSPYGPELLTNGDFSNGETGWNDVFGNITTGGGVAQFTAGGARLDQSIPALAGRTYEVVMEISAYVSGGIYLQFTGLTPTLGTTRNAVGTFTEQLTLAENGNASIRSVGGSNDVSLTLISIREVL